MASAEGSYLGLSIQNAYDTPQTDSTKFKYLLFNEGGVAVNNVQIPLDPEVGGGALIRSLVKVAVSSAGAVKMVPRPDTLGMFMYGSTGKVTSTAQSSSGANHGVVGPVALLVGAQTGYDTKLHQPDEPIEIYVVGNQASVTGNVTLHGYVSGSLTTEVLALNGMTRVPGVKHFSAITAIDFPAYAVAGDSVEVGYLDGYYTHQFEFPEDQFDAPYYTLRSAPGAMWGEQMNNCRVNMMALEWQAARFVSGTVGFQGGMPSIITTDQSVIKGTGVGDWNALSLVDAGPQFLAPYGEIELPTGTEVNVLGGSFVSTSNIPLDEQYVVGSFAPQGLDIVSRAYALTLTVKVTDPTLYNKMVYDSVGGADWAASVFREANFKLKFRSDVGQYEFNIAGNGSTGHDANVVWTAQPISLRAQRQVVMQVSGIFLASPTATAPITMNLINKHASYAYA